MKQYFSNDNNDNVTIEGVVVKLKMNEPTLWIQLWCGAPCWMHVGETLITSSITAVRIHGKILLYIPDMDTKSAAVVRIE